MFFSIITVVYNGANTIRDTIESILNQNYMDYEYIVIDGASTDQTVEIVNEYKPRFGGRLTLISEPDKGIYNAMNKGIKIAKGDYIWIVNSDDWIHDNALQLIHDKYLTLNNPNAILCGGINLISPKTQTIIRSAFSGGKHFDTMEKTFKMGVCHPATIVPSVIYQRVGSYDENYYIAADLDFIIRCKNDNIPFVFSDEIYSNFRMDGISNRFPIGKNIHDYRILLSKFISNPIRRSFVLFKFKIRAVFLCLIGSRVEDLIMIRQAIKKPWKIQ